MECERCKADVPIGSLRVDSKNKRLVCENCYNYIKKGTLIPEVKKPVVQESRRKLTLSTVERLEHLGQKKEEYQCKNCSYKFASIKNYRGKCPYCGEDGVVPFIPESNLTEIDEFI